ncbi:MAG: RnfABCDGE type electron transport complex subunit B, partial [Pseudomonadota bacterium]|nr:RnfABCDGE type electron transport complex subunit B [Pseudomonadota bacterium]
AALARLTNVGLKPLNPDFRVYRTKEIARIDEDACIGCVLCIKACPVDAIVGAARLMHTVIENECTGCELCLPACPTDCIDLRQPATETHGRQSPWSGFTLEQIDKARRRSEQKLRRLAAREEARRQRRHRLQKAQMQREIQAAVARVRTRRASPGNR